ncbi:MAG: peroxiredoxin [Candidatus Paracaedibacteraceae bacterium]|nr:peroxiredoxin [Candidatus Paracaedibacteraceae bacterium]
MSINVGSLIPNVTVKSIVDGQVQEVNLKEYLSNKKVVLFAVPGAFTGVCSKDHLPTYVEQFDALKSKGIDAVLCLAVNDIPVLTAWSDAHNAGKLIFIADWDAALTKAMGMDVDLSAFTLGVRSKRYAAVIENGVVTHLNVEDSPGVCSVSKADSVVDLL